MMDQNPRLCANVEDNYGVLLKESWTSPELLETPWTFENFPEFPPEIPAISPRTSLIVDLWSNPEVPWKFPGLSRKFSKPPQKQPDLSRCQSLSLGSLARSDDSQRLPLTITSPNGIDKRVEKSMKRPQGNRSKDQHNPSRK